MSDPTPAQQLRVPARPADALTQALSQALAPFTARLGAMDEEQERQGHILNGLMGHLGLRAEQAGEDPDAPKAPITDTIWGCAKCGSRLGMYDSSADVVRLRYKEFIVHAHIGVGGWVRAVCRGCAELNVVEYAPSVGESAGEMPQVQVVGDRLVLDEPLLLQMLAMVRERSGQRFVVQLVQAPAPDPR